MELLTKEKWITKMKYKEIIRAEKPFSNPTMRTIEFEESSLTAIQNEIFNYETSNGRDGDIDVELLKDCIKEIGYGLLKSSPTRYTIKYTHFNGYTNNVMFSEKHTK